jgi:hypothetical protein
MPSSPFAHLRRRLALAGGRPATAPTESAGGRRDEATYRPSTLVDGVLRHVPLAPLMGWVEPVAFLDGTQHVELVGYVGTHPVVAAVVRAGVRLRVERRLRAGPSETHRLVIGHPEALARLDEVRDGERLVALATDEPPHPVRDLDRAHAEVDRARAALELAMAAAFRSVAPETWLVVDGSLAASPEWARDERMVGIVKSHASLPFEGDDLETYLTLPAGHRTSLFRPQSRQVAPVLAWGLRLWPWAGHDLFHGLVRVEVADTERMLRIADLLSCHLLAERAPLAADARADRLLYGIHDVERWLRAQGA